METTVSSTSGGGGVTVVASDAPSNYQIAPRSDSNQNSTAGSAPPAPPQAPPAPPQAPPAPPQAPQAPSAPLQAPPPHTPSAAATMPLKKKRGRPRKYGPDGSVTMALSPKPISSAAPASSPVIDFSVAKHKKIKPVSKAKYELENLGEWVACSVGANFTPHIITVNAGEDVTMKIISFSQQGPRAICVLSANGVISSVTLRQPDSSGGTLTYEGRFEILSLSGSFMPSETGGARSRSGGMSVSLASPDGRVVGGGVAGLLVAASPVQVVVGSFLAGNQHEQKPKKQKQDSLSGAMPTSAIPISSADPKSNFSSSSFRGDSWSPLPPESRNKPADINLTLPAGNVQYCHYQDQNVNEVKHFRCNVLLSSNKFPGSARIFGREMKLVALPVSLFITFSLVASVVLNFSSAVFLYLLFNILLWVIILWSYKPSKVEFDGLWPTLQSLCDGEEDPCAMNKVENQSNGNAESSCEVAGDTCFKSENHNNEKDQGNGNAESSCEVAGDTYVESKSENHNNEKDRDNGNGKDNDEKYGCSDGCDDDDDGSAGAIGWQDVDEEFDDNLKKRIEDFIAKVNKRWREERLIEASNKQSPLSSAVVPES
uniref:AT-hook motif nuclear-localized protein n=1 Tax=Salix viminalis TaxID=40686 RepID=A0A6N2JYN8_SALVM